MNFMINTTRYRVSNKNIKIEKVYAKSVVTTQKLLYFGQEQNNFFHEICSKKLILFEPTPSIAL